MVPSATIERILLRHAGSPQQVVDALIDAANDAGGHDNVTVVYAEGAGFAGWARTRQGEAAAGVDVGPAAGQDDRASAGRDARRPPPPGRRGARSGAFARWVIGSRTTWFALGALAGVLAALGLVWRVGDPSTCTRPHPGCRGGTSGAFPQIAAALAAAMPGDTVRVEPGVYEERIVVPDGVDLVARVPGSVTLRREPGSIGIWVAITTIGRPGRPPGGSPHRVHATRRRLTWASG